MDKGANSIFQLDIVPRKKSKGRTPGSNPRTAFLQAVSAPLFPCCVLCNNGYEKVAVFLLHYSTTCNTKKINLQVAQKKGLTSSPASSASFSR